MNTRVSVFAALVMVFFALPVPPATAQSPTFEEAMSDYDSQRYAEAYQKLSTLAHDGNAQAQFRLALMFHQGRGAPRNFRQAAQWYRRAADQGNAEAQNNLGVIYRRGEGIRANKVLAMMWFSLGAAQLNAKALENQNALALDMTKDQAMQAQHLTAEYMAQLFEKTQKTARQAARKSGFVVQLGMFAKKSNVDRIAAQLQTAGMTLSDEIVASNGNSYHRLRVGPFDSEEDAEKIAQRMDKIFKLRSTVLRR